MCMCSLETGARFCLLKPELSYMYCICQYQQLTEVLCWIHTVQLNTHLSRCNLDYG